MEDPDANELNSWAPKLVDALKRAARAPGCEQRSTGQGTSPQRIHRPEHRFALRHPAAGHRRYPLRRLRPADGIDHFYPVEPVPGHFSRQARVHAGPGATGVHLSSRRRRRSGPALRLHPDVRDNGPSPREPSGAVPVCHRLLQPATRRVPREGGAGGGRNDAAGCSYLPASAGASRGRPRSSGHPCPTSPSSSSRPS